MRVLFHNTLLATLDALEEAVVGRLFLEVLIPKKSSSLAREYSGNPGISIRDTPDSHADTPLDGKAAAGDSLKSRSLGGQLRGSGGSVHADVDLSVDNVDVQGSEAVENSLKCCLGGQKTSGRGNLLGKVSLKANTVDVRTVALNELNNALGSERLVAVVLKVVVVVEQLGVGAGLFSKLESKWDEGLSDGVVEGRRAVGTVLVQCLVDDVPACADILVTTGKVEDVVLHDGDQGRVVKLAIPYPGWQLAVPDESVAVNLLLILLGPVTVAVGIGVGEVVAAGLSHLPLHGILGCETRVILAS